MINIMQHKIKLVLLAALFGVSGILPAAKKQLVDEVIAIIYHAEGNEPVLYSDTLTSIDGQERTLQDVIIERLMVLDARKYKILVSDEELDRFIGLLLTQNKWTRSDLVMFLDERGYTLADGRELLRNKQMINQIIDYKVRSDKRMMISRDQALEYYKGHPSKEEATFTLDIAYVPASEYKKSELEALIKAKKLPKEIAFDEPFTLKESELAADRQFIAKEKPGAVVLIEELEDGFEITRLVEKTVACEIPFDTAYSAIVSQMRQERFGQVLESYRSELLENAHIKYCGAYSDANKGEQGR